MPLPGAIQVVGTVDTIGEVQSMLGAYTRKETRAHVLQRMSDVLDKWAMGRDADEEVDAVELNSLAMQLAPALAELGADPKPYVSALKLWSEQLQKKAGQPTGWTDVVWGTVKLSAEDAGIADDPSTDKKPFPWIPVLIGLVVVGGGAYALKE